jgi:hypothetical protein
VSPCIAHTVTEQDDSFCQWPLPANCRDYRIGLAPGAAATVVNTLEWNVQHYLRAAGVNVELRTVADSLDGALADPQVDLIVEQLAVVTPLLSRLLAVSLGAGPAPNNLFADNPEFRRAVLEHVQRVTLSSAVAWQPLRAGAHQTVGVDHSGAPN